MKSNWGGLLTWTILVPLGILAGIGGFTVLKSLTETERVEHWKTAEMENFGPPGCDIKELQFRVKATMYRDSGTLLGSTTCPKGELALNYYDKEGNLKYARTIYVRGSAFLNRTFDELETEEGGTFKYTFKKSKW